ncbi:hypothetical protein GQR58_030197 [Nymphon striatum]|nr:hypothetical protein GQR58_030197 [Nymphon striatum]
MTWKVLPSPVLHAIFSTRFQGINKTLLAVDSIETSTKEITVAATGQKITAYCICVNGEVSLCAEIPSASHIKITKPAREKHGIAPEYSKVLIDYVVRYTYPHLKSPILALPFPQNERGTFHKQHRNLAQESSDFSNEQREKLSTVFTPQGKWLIFDVGTYLAHGTIRLAQDQNHKPRIIAVEASPQNHAIASENLKLNNIENVELRNAAIWKVSGEEIDFSFTQNQANAIASDVIESSKKVKVVTTSLAELTHEQGRPADLVSLTVNGAEIEAIESLEDVEPKLLPKRMIVPGWYKLNGEPRSVRIVKMLTDLGYQCLTTSHDLVFAWRDEETPT